MRDFKDMTDIELTSWMVDKINALDSLMHKVSFYNKGELPRSEISEMQSEYKRLKETVENAHHNISLARNYEGSDFYMGYFCCGVTEASKSGFSAPINSRNGNALYESVEIAYNSLNYQMSMSQWNKLAEDESQE